ncbi:hypothetical protein LCR01_04830 [Companilactobacillus crustorum]|uniref:Uncharacterized protein n=1 Tax=Companilactobacillus crustorum TaxID=392416 RepID=A0AB34A8V9_9LACO|nr:hypothetical protein LCR01_04830 [Companilactobacillus crustorum]
MVLLAVQSVDLAVAPVVEPFKDLILSIKKVHCDLPFNMVITMDFLYISNFLISKHDDVLYKRHLQE